MAMTSTESLTFEKVWAMFQESDKKFKESREEFNRQMKESDKKFQESFQKSREEFDRRMEETDRQIKEYNRRFGEFTNRFGEVVEYMLAPNMREKFMELGYDFSKSNSGTRVEDHQNNIYFEIDILLENYRKAVLVEVKTKLTTEYVKEHIKRLEKMRKYADLHDDKRTFLGAVAGVVMTANVKKYALEQGLFVIEPTGETLYITPPNGKPKEW